MILPTRAQRRVLEHEKKMADAGFTAYSTLEGASEKTYEVCGARGWIDENGITTAGRDALARTFVEVRVPLPFELSNWVREAAHAENLTPTEWTRRLIVERRQRTNGPCEWCGAFTETSGKPKICVDGTACAEKQAANVASLKVACRHCGARDEPLIGDVNSHAFGMCSDAQACERRKQNRSTKACPNDHEPDVTCVDCPRP